MSKQKILIAPLNWGLGHASRCVPLIRKFVRDGDQVILTAHGRSLKLLQSEFPELEFVDSPSVSIRYSSHFPQWLMIVFQLPILVLGIYRENLWLKRFVKKSKPDLIISDNRYGLFSSRVKCVLITHQLMIKCPSALKFLEVPLYRLIKHFVKKYDECWVPDTEGHENLSGDLSHKFPSEKNTRYIGWLSRFRDHDHPLHTYGSNQYDICFLLSGPEPQRSRLEDKFLAMSNVHGKKIMVVAGTPGENESSHRKNNFEYVNHLNGTELKKVLMSSSIIVCRAGYSSIMDLKTLGKNVVLIPTPGQTEQEYLAEYLTGKYKFLMIDQEKLKGDVGQFEQMFQSGKEDYSAGQAILTGGNDNRTGSNCVAPVQGTIIDENFVTKRIFIEEQRKI